MKIILSMLLLVSSLLVGCDRQVLEGLNLKFNAEVKSDYDKEKNVSEENKDNKELVTENENKALSNSSPTELITEKESKETIVDNNEKQEVNEVTQSDPDQPMAFKDIKECSKAGITAKTNEIFYTENPQVKSIDSKNEKQVKAWKKVYTEVEKNCNN